MKKTTALALALALSNTAREREVVFFMCSIKLFIACCLYARPSLIVRGDTIMVPFSPCATSKVSLRGPVHYVEAARTSGLCAPHLSRAPGLEECWLRKRGKDNNNNTVHACYNDHTPAEVRPAVCSTEMLWMPSLHSFFLTVIDSFLLFPCK